MCGSAGVGSESLLVVEGNEKEKPDWAEAADSCFAKRDVFVMGRSSLDGIKEGKDRYCFSDDLKGL